MADFTLPAGWRRQGQGVFVTPEGLVLRAARSIEETDAFRSMCVLDSDNRLHVVAGRDYWSLRAKYGEFAAIAHSLAKIHYFSLRFEGANVDSYPRNTAANIATAGVLNQASHAWVRPRLCRYKRDANTAVWVFTIAHTAIAGRGVLNYGATGFIQSATGVTFTNATGLTTPIDPYVHPKWSGLTLIYRLPLAATYEQLVDNFILGHEHNDESEVIAKHQAAAALTKNQIGKVLQEQASLLVPFYIGKEGAGIMAPAYHRRHYKGSDAGETAKLVTTPIQGNVFQMEDEYITWGNTFAAGNSTNGVSVPYYVAQRVESVYTGTNNLTFSGAGPFTTTNVSESFRTVGCADNVLDILPVNGLDGAYPARVFGPILESFIDTTTPTTTFASIVAHLRNQTSQGYKFSAGTVTEGGNPRVATPAEALGAMSLHDAGPLDSLSLPATCGHGLDANFVGAMYNFALDEQTIPASVVNAISPYATSKWADVSLTG